MAANRWFEVMGPDEVECHFCRRIIKPYTLRFEMVPEPDAAHPKKICCCWQCALQPDDKRLS